MGLFKNKKQEVNQINNKELKEKLLDNALAFLVNANEIQTEDNNSIVGIKVNETDIPAKCIMIIKKYQNLPISEIKQKIEDNKYVLTCDYIDNNGIKYVLELYNELSLEGVNCSLYEHNNPTTIEFLSNLLGSYEETKKQVEEDIENEVQAENYEEE